MTASIAEQVALLNPVEREFILAELPGRHLEWEWWFWARPEQLPPQGDWRYWLIKAGRGFGKTRAGAEWVREQVKHYEYVNVIGATADDARDIMIDGESGILAICPEHERPYYASSKRRLEWPNGARSLIFTADEPERLRGKQHARLWADEVGAWRYPDAWDQAMFGLRLGRDPRAVATTTPRPTRAIRELMSNQHTVITAGTSYDNAGNLAPAFIDAIIKKYEGTRLGRQELLAELLEDNPGALWTRGTLDGARVSVPPHLTRVLVAVDPEAASSEDAAETGIIVAGLGADGHAYVLADRTLRGTPAQWGAQVAAAYNTHSADRIVAEINQGGAMVEHVIRTVGGSALSYKGVHASRGKQARAEPVAALYEQGRVHHVGAFPQLEDQLCDWAPNTGQPSPDRLDALVWAITGLMLEQQELPTRAIRPRSAA